MDALIEYSVGSLWRDGSSSLMSRGVSAHSVMVSGRLYVYYYGHLGNALQRWSDMKLGV